jgi:hypothetical protein
MLRCGHPLTITRLSPNPNAPRSRGYYHRVVHPTRPVPVRLGAASVVFLLALLCLPATARAAAQAFDVGPQPVVQIVLPDADVTIKTWDRDTVKADWADADAVSALRGVTEILPVLRIRAQAVLESNGKGDPIGATLPPEDFPLGLAAPGLHDFIRVSAPMPNQLSTPVPAALPTPARVVVMIPAATRVLYVRLTHGSLQLEDYRGTSVIYTGNARVTLSRMGGDAFIQANGGSVHAADSTFNLLRARSNRAQMVFERCHIRQIDATSLTGPIVYDNGTFEPGLAHFESDRGNIALGVTGNAQIVAHSDDGRVYSLLAGSHPEGVASDDRAQIGTGGLIVSASSGHGNVYLYEGTLASHRNGLAVWKPIRQVLAGNRRPAGAARAPKAVQPAPPVRRKP